MIIALLSAPLAMAATNTIEHSIRQVTEGSTTTGEFTVTQNANVIGVITGQNDYLSQNIDQYFHQDFSSKGSPFNSSNNANFTNSSLGDINNSIYKNLAPITGDQGVFSQDSRMTAAILGNDNLVAQESNQTLMNNRLKYSRIGQIDIHLAIIAANNSVIKQKNLQNASGNNFTDTTLSQLANETAVIIGNSSSINQKIDQRFIKGNLTQSTQTQSTNLRLLAV